MKGRGAIFILAALLCLPLMTGCEEEEHVHAPRYVEGREATCTEAGYAGYWECALCGARFSDEAGKQPAEIETIPALGHNTVSEEVKPAGCEEEGLLVTRCLRCGAEEESVLPPTGHLYGAWEQTLAPSCDREGKEAHICAYCGASETRALPALAHEFGTDNVCKTCSYRCVSSEGLAFTPVSGEGGAVRGYAVSLGTAKAAHIIVAPYHEGLPVVAVAEGGFRDCITLTRFTCYAPLAEVGAEAFRGCAALSETELPDSVEEVGEMAFYGCGNMTSLSLGSGVKSIGKNAFYGLSSLESITVSEQNSVYSGKGNCLVEKATGTLLLGSAQSVIPDDVKKIGDNAFLNNEAIREIALPKGVTRIGTAAFNGCKGLTSLTFLGTQEEWERVEKGDGWCDYAPFGEVRFAE